MWHDTKKIVSEPRAVPHCFSLYHLDAQSYPSNTSCDPWSPGQLDAGRLHYRRVCIYVAHGKQCRSSSLTTWYLSYGNIFSIVLIMRSKPGLRFLYSYSSRNSSRCSPLLSLTSPPRPRICAEDLRNPAGAPSEEDILHATKLKKVDMCVITFLWHYLTVLW